MASPSL